jgi:glycosyltransferase involved in cell wall biosynthesis
MASRVFINGRFLTQRPTGVQRFAMETVRAIDALLDGPPYSGRVKAILLCPAGTPDPGLRNIAFRAGGRFKGGYAWEQLDLPGLATGGGSLLGLCNLGPVAKHRQVVVVHDATPRVMPGNFSRGFRLAYRVLIPILARVAARIVTISAFSRAEIARWYGIRAATVTLCAEGGEHILHQPADLAVLARNGLSNRRYFLAVGVGSANKNVETVIAAFKAAGLDDVSLVLTGKRSARVHPTAAAASEPAEYLESDALCYVGHVSDGELRALYENALALVYPSRYEGFGLPPVEAMTCGCPVIISDQPALLEVAGDSGAVLVTGMDDVAGLARRLKELATDESLRLRLAQRGKAHAERFRWSHTAAILLDHCIAVGR